MPFIVYTEELSSRTEVCDFILLHESGFDVVDGGPGVSWIEDLHVIDIEKKVFAAIFVNAAFDVQVRIGQRLFEA